MNGKNEEDPEFGMPIIEESTHLPTINRFDLGFKSNTFGGMSPEDRENSFKYVHMRSGSFGGGFEPSVHSSTAPLPNE